MDQLAWLRMHSLGANHVRVPLKGTMTHGP